MTATPAQVANDLMIQAQYFAKSDAQVSQACRDCARLIRAFLAGEKVDGRTYCGVETRMCAMWQRYAKAPGTQIGKSVFRGLNTLQELHGQLVRAAR